MTDLSHVPAPAGGHTGSLAVTRWFPESFEARSGEFLFVQSDRSDLASQNFLDGRWQHAHAPRKRLSARALLEDTPRQAPSPHIIWHSGFCCSTLLAKALERPGANLSLCEPRVLVDLAEARRTGLVSAEEIPALVGLAFHHLSCRFAASEHTTIKPSPAANSLLREASSHTSGAMLFLFGDCRSFVISVCKLGEEGRKYARRLFLALLADGHAPAHWPTPRLLALSDLELAAVVWHMQIAEFLRTWPSGGRAASLDCDALLAAPEECLRRLDRFFSLGLGAQHVQSLTDAGFFARNAKTGEFSFDAARRREEHKKIERAMAGDVDRIVAQSYVMYPTTPRGMPLPAPVMSVEKSYCP